MPQIRIARTETLRRARVHIGGLGRIGTRLAIALQEASVGVISGNDPQMFYDIILRRRNWCNASFCCGAGSVHRREAVMQAALKAYVDQVSAEVEPVTAAVADQQMRRDLHALMVGEAARATELTPYKFHVSEDIYTSIVLHSDPERRWRSVFHPEALSRMVHDDRAQRHVLREGGRIRRALEPDGDGAHGRVGP